MSNILTTEEKLSLFQEKVKADVELKRKVLLTKSAKDPLSEFHKICIENGCEVTLWELADGAQEFCDAMLRSVNGGGVEAPDGWNDYYELFLRAIE